VSLRYALLALLSAGPMTGYEISRRFQSSVGHVWHAPDSQIYPELRKMEADGLVTGEDVDAGPRGRKRLYRPTDQGTEAFREWMNAPLKYALDRDPAILRAAYLEWSSPEAARQMMHDHIEHFEALIKQYDRQVFEIDERLNAVLLRRLSGLPEETQHRVAAFKRFAYEGLIARAETEIGWARRGLRLLERYSPTAPAPSGSEQEDAHEV
jgi:PadR family transcriptional regulator, regulator of vanillate utilization